MMRVAEIFYQDILAGILIETNEGEYTFEADDKWSLSPAYDLLNLAIVNPQNKEELALTLDGKRRNQA